MISIFSTCRSFENPHFNIIQRNAIGSWLHLKEKPQIILIGNDPGTKEICEEFSLTHVPNIRLSKFGTPFLKDMFEAAHELSIHDVLLLVSSDIIIFDEVIDALPHLKKLGSFMGGVHRHNTNITELIDFNTDWVSMVKSNMLLGHPGAGDFFLFSKGFWRRGIPDFTIGRSVADNWLIHEAITFGQCVDMSDYMNIVHQNHDYSHIPYGGNLQSLINGEERRDNLELGQVCLRDDNEIRFANWNLTKEGVKRRR